MLTNALLLLAGTMAVPATTRQGELRKADEIAAQIHAAWQATPGLYVRYAQHVILDAAADEAGAAVYHGPWGEEIVHIYEDARRYTQVFASDPPRYEEQAYDGTYYYRRYRPAPGRTGATGETTPLVLMPSSFLRDRKATMAGYGFYFECVGCPVYDGVELLIQFHRRILALSSHRAPFDGEIPFSLYTVLRSNAYKVASASDVEHDGCVKIVGPGDRLWLDRRLNYALTRREVDWGPAMPRQFVLELTDFRKMREGLWLPQTITQWRYAAPEPNCPVPDEPVARVVLTLVEAKPGPFPDETFQLFPTRGANVYDTTLLTNASGDPVPIQYVYGATPEETQAALDEAIQEQRHAIGERERARAWWYVNVVLLLAVAASLAYTVVRRRWAIPGQHNTIAE